MKYLALLLLLPCAAMAQFTTNLPGVRSNTFGTFNTNSPAAVAVGLTDWPPRPTFTNFFMSEPSELVTSFTLQGFSWTNQASRTALPGAVEVWNANQPTNWGGTPTNWQLVQLITLTNSSTNQSLELTNASLTGHLWVRVRHRFGPYRSEFSTTRTNIITPP